VSKVNISRREFVKGLAVAGAMTATAGTLAGCQKESSAAVPKKWDEEADVVVVGSGFAALAAAIEAKEAGASVKVIEKMPVAGGNSIINGGVVSAAGSPIQAAEGIEDSPDLMLQDMLKAGLGLNHPDLARVVAEHSNETVQWTINYLGVEYKDKAVHLGGHSVPRSYSTHNSSGSAIVTKQLAKLEELGVKVGTNRKMTRLIQDEDGRVKGIEIEDDYRFPDEGSGTVKTIKAKKAVILATGGFGRDLYFRTIQDPRLGEEVDCTNQKGATGEALVQALGLGATPLQLSWIQLGPWASPDEEGFGMAPHFAAGACFPYGVMVDPETGKRFVNELADRKVRADAILKTGKPAIGIADAKAAGHALAGLADKLIEAGVVKKFDTLEALAAEFNIPFDALQETIENYNRYVEQGEDEEFGKYFRSDIAPLGESPWYSVRLWPKVHHCMGGVLINTKAQVVSLDKQPIKGLYAAGEVTGGVHGACRLGSAAVIDCLVFGRVAGQNAVKEEAWG